MDLTFKIITAALAAAAIGVTVFGLIRYYKARQDMKRQSYDESTFNPKVFRAVYVLMGALAAGDAAFIVAVFAVQAFEFVYLIPAVVFILAAVFGVFMVRLLQKMSNVLSKKTTETIQLMIDVMETKDFYTKGHSEHVRKLVELIYDALPAAVKKTININMLRDAAILHDIGKTSTLDSVLSKPGMLAVNERDLLRQHTTNGKAILEKTAYKNIADWVYYHHERVDGKGYYNLPGDQIPLESKILAVADTFSALYSDRPYRKKFPFEKSMGIVKEVAGTQLDPYIVKIFAGIGQEKIDTASADGVKIA